LKRPTGRQPLATVLAAAMPAGANIDRQWERGLDGTVVLNRGSGAGRIRVRGAKR
jgi:hypothetical protein